MRLNKRQRETIINSANEIIRLTTLETCGLSQSTKDELLRTGWLGWFSIEAETILSEVLN